MLSKKNNFRRGATAIEYGLLAALIIVLCLFALTNTGVNLKNIFNDLGIGMSKSSGGITLSYNGGTSWTSQGGLEYLSNKGVLANDINAGAASEWPANGLQVIAPTTSSINLPLGKYFLTIPAGYEVWYNYQGSDSISFGPGVADPNNVLSSFCSQVGGSLQNINGGDGSELGCVPPTSANISYSGIKSAINLP